MQEYVIIYRGEFLEGKKRERIWGHSFDDVLGPCKDPEENSQPEYVVCVKVKALGISGGRKEAATNMEVQGNVRLAFG